MSIRNSCQTIVAVLFVAFLLAGCVGRAEYSSRPDVKKDLHKAAMLTSTAINEFNKRNYVVAEELCADALDLMDDFYQSQLGCAKVYFELSKIRKDPEMCRRAEEHCAQGVDLLVSREDISCKMGHIPQADTVDRAFSLLGKIKSGCNSLDR